MSVPPTGAKPCTFPDRQHAMDRASISICLPPDPSAIVALQWGINCGLAENTSFPRMLSFPVPGVWGNARQACNLRMGDDVQTAGLRRVVHN